MILEEGMSVSQIARDLEIAKEIIYRWKKDYELNETNSFPGKGKLL